MADSIKRLVVIPTDPIHAYEKKGTSSWLARYYNPCQMFDEVYAVSPMETVRRSAYGMEIVPAPRHEHRRIVAGLKPHAIRAYGGHWTTELALLSRPRGVPVVASVHDVRADFGWPCVRYADLVICVSSAVESAVAKRGVPSERIRLVPNRVDLDQFNARADEAAVAAVRRRLPAGRLILHVGRKSHEKNLDTTIGALKHLPEDYFVVFVGAGDASPYQALAKRLNVDHRCYWIEAIPNSELPHWYQASDCVCVPSRCEGFGLVFIEAAACGAAIVTSDVAPMNTYLRHAHSACLVADFENGASVAKAVRAVCEDASMRERLRCGAIEAAAPFSRSIVDQIEVRVYEEALRMAPPATSIAARAHVHYDGIRRRLRPLAGALAARRWLPFARSLQGARS